MNIYKRALLLMTMLCVLVSSCVNTQKATYFNLGKDTQIPSTVAVPEAIVQPNDILGISVSSLNPDASAVFNSPNISYASATTSSGSTLQSSGYLVNSNGYIQFPMLGTIKVSGLTINQLHSKIMESIVDKKLLVDPIVSIRLLNFKVTVLGEVTKPSVISVTNEKITLLEALGLAGDISIYGKKDQVMVIREENGTKNIKYLNLNSSELFTSPYYY